MILSVMSLLPSDTFCCTSFRGGSDHVIQINRIIIDKADALHVHRPAH